MTGSNMEGVLDVAGAGDGKYIWGTTISLQESMNIFTEFLRNFKPKYRGEFNKKQREAYNADTDSTMDLAIPPPANPLYDNLSPTKANETLYLTYLRTMRITQQTNLNLDAVNLLSYPSTRKFYYQLLAYPQEIVPIMDQVLKDTLIEVTREDAENKEEGFERDLLLEEEREMSARNYKVRPFGTEKTVNMRDLNPGGELGTLTT